MKTQSGTRQVAYVITSAGRDVYSAMTRLSVASLRLSNPGTTAMLVTDRESAQALTAARDPLLGEVDTHHSFDTPEGPATYRNRFLKTNLRNLLDGPYLFLDSDIMIRADLGEVFACGTDLAAAPNHSKDAHAEQIWDADEAMLAQFGWHVRADVYVNGGALFCDDTPGARRFGRDWHDRWLASYARTGRYRDQPALNAAVAATGVSVTVLPHRFNAQFKTQVRTARTATIWHCYAAAGNAPVTEFEAIVESLMSGADLDRERIAIAMARSHPWRRDSWRDDWVARIIELKGYLGLPEILWLSGYRGQEVIALARKLWRDRHKTGPE